MGGGGALDAELKNYIFIFFVDEDNKMSLLKI